jgi:hypothetical protein
MEFAGFLDIILNPVVLIMTGLVVAPFAVVAWSLWVTWIENTHKVKNMKGKRDLL